MLRRETGIFEEVGWGIEEVGLKKRKLVWGVNWMKRNDVSKLELVSFLSLDTFGFYLPLHWL